MSALHAAGRGDDRAAVALREPHASGQERSPSMTMLAMPQRLLRVLGRAGWALADQAMVSAVNFLTIYLLARHLEPSVFGAFILAYTGLMLLTGVQNALLVQPHNVLGAALPRTRYQLFTGALVLAQLGYCVAVLATLALASWLVHDRSEATAGVLLSLAIAAVPWMTQEFVRRALYTRGEARAAAINDWITYGLQISGIGFLVFERPEGLTSESALLMLGSSSLIGTAAGLWQLRDHVRLGGSGSVGEMRETWREVWHFGKWLTAQNAMSWLGSQGHSWLVGMLLGVEQVGLYRAATHLVNVMNPLFQTAFNHLPSRGSIAYEAGGVDGLAHWVKRMQWLLILVPVPFCLVLAGFPHWVLQLAYGEKYAGTDMALILALSAIAVCITFAKFPFDIGLLAMRSTKSIFHAYLIPVVLLLTSGTALVGSFGIVGVPVSALVINVALLVATWAAYRGCVKRGGHG